MNKKILLIADDDDMSREVIIRFFQNVYEVIEAKNGRETLDILHSRQVDIVILDIVMPELTGFEVLQKVKCEEKYNDLRILVATSMQEKTERRALELGADDIVFKPYDPIVIKKRLDNLLLMQDQKRELEAALSKAEQANRAKTDFLSRISHDMRTPLNGILGITALMKSSNTDEKTHEDLLQLEMSGKYLLNLINDTLDVNKIESGNLELHPDIYDGRSSLNTILELFRPNLKEKKIHFSFEADNLPYSVLYIDMGRLQQVVMNILANAVKFTPEGGSIHASIVNLFHDDKIIKDRITIQDSGVGMSAEFLPHLFEPFSQENPGSTGNTTGTGLGMTITKEIIQLMGGSIKVESELGKGTKFIIDLPMKVATKEQIQNWKRLEKTDYNIYNYQGKRILLCEDHPLNAQIATRLLEKKGMFVDHAADGKAGVEMFQKSDSDYYDMILMDIRMPVMDGLEATRSIRALPRKDAQRIPIVAMTANAFSEDIQQSLEAGMDDHLGKPIEVDKLFACISKMLHLKRHHIKKCILIVDDLEINRSVIKEALKDEFDIYEAENGQEALDILDRLNGIDLVITDIQMPVMNGLELIKTMRSQSRFDQIAIIANTQFGDPEQEEEILNMGANDFVYKPTTAKIIELRVRNTMSRL